MRRTFVAVDISEEARQAASLFVDELRSVFPSVRVGWERPEKLHLTLRFVGDADELQVAALEKIINTIGENHSKFEVTLQGTGKFPTRGQARILWLGVNAPQVLTTIVQGLEAECRGLGFEPETRRYSPHLTIGRVREPGRADGLAHEHVSRAFGPVQIPIEEIVMYESRLRPGGSIYERVAAAPLITS